MILRINCFILFLFSVFNCFSQEQINTVNTANVDFRFSEGKVFITYDILNSKPNERYTITANFFRESGAKLNAISVSGDLSEVAGGNGKTIIWEQKKDGYILDEKIYISLSISTKVNIPIATHLLKSAVYPGWGDYKIRNGKYHFLYGALGFGAIGASVYFNSLAQKNYNSYKTSFDFNESNKLFNKARQQQNLSYVFAGGACFVWTIDLALLYKKTNKVRKNITEENSKYYYQKSQRTNLFTSKTGYINTKSPYDLAMERGEKSFLAEKYEEAKIAYEEALKFERTETVNNKLISVNRVIDEEKNKTTAYNINISKGQAFLAQQKYKEARSEFESASKIKPKEKYPFSKIDEIDEQLAKLEKQRLYNEQMEQGVALLNNKNWSNAITNFETALKYKPNDVIAINKIAECENGIEIENEKNIDIEYQQKMRQGKAFLATKKFEEAKEVFEQASQLKPNELEPRQKVDECDYFIRLEITKNENEPYIKLNLLENLKIDYPSKSNYLDKLIAEAKRHQKIIIPLVRVGNSNKIKAKINGTLTFDFILDTGADNVLVSPEIFITFCKAGLITNTDFIGKNYFSIADGSSVVGYKFYLREIQIGDIVLYNVEASVIEGGSGDMLLGGSVFKKIGKITIDYDNDQLIIDK